MDLSIVDTLVLPKVMDGAFQEVGKLGLTGTGQLAAFGVRTFLLAGSAWVGPFLQRQEMPWTTRPATRRR